MFRNRWNLQESPFRGTLDWRRFFAAPTHEEALARLHFLVDEARPLGLLLGPTGSGKSLILEVFARQLLRSGAQVANVNLSRLDLHEFLWLIAAELGINPDRREEPFRLWRGVLDRLTENRYQQLPTVLLLDDVDEAATPVLDHVARLAQINNTPRGRLSIVLSANGHALGRLTPRLLELAELRVDLEPWEPTDTVEYIRSALVQAGADGPVFSDEALQHLHDLCCGIPRRVNRLANIALLAGAGRDLAEIDVDTVEGAHLELGIVRAVAELGYLNVRPKFSVQDRRRIVELTSGGTAALCPGDAACVALEWQPSISPRQAIIESIVRPCGRRFAIKK